jgi:hypothetical protein
MPAVESNVLAQQARTDPQANDRVSYGLLFPSRHRPILNTIGRSAILNSGVLIVAYPSTGATVFQHTP